MAYEVTISDTVDEMTIKYPSPPLVEDTIEAVVENETLDFNVYLDVLADDKRVWQLKQDIMTEADYDRLKGFYDRQRTLWLFPTISIPDLNVQDVVVRMTLSGKQIKDNCGRVEGVRASFRETIQESIDWSSGSS